MATHRRGAGGPRPPRPEAQAEERGLAAVLWWRTRLLLRSLSPAQVRAIRFLPATLQTSFPFPGLRDEAPGVEGTQVGRRWALLANGFGLPAPVSTRRGRRIVSSLLVTVGEDGVVGWAIPSPEASSEEIRRLDARVDRIRSVLAGHLDLVVLYGEAPGVVPRLAAFGALVAGRLPSTFWPAPEESPPLEPTTAARVAVDAPTPFSTLAVALLAAGGGPAPAVALRAALASGLPPRALADPELFAALWAGRATGREDELLRALELTSRDPATRRLAATLRSPGGTGSRRELRGAARLLGLGRGLTLAAVRAASHAAGPIRSSLRERLRRHAIEPGAPAALLPAIGRALADAGISSPADLPSPVPEGRGFVVLDGDRGVLARGATVEQARLRATALAARALGSSPATGPGRVVRRPLAETLAAPPQRRRTLLTVEAADAPGPPFDPLNRGPERRLGFGPSCAIVLRPGYRPTALRLAPGAVVDRLFDEALVGGAIEVAAAGGAAEPAASRLERLYRQATGRWDPLRPPALEAGGRVFLLGDRVRSFSLQRFASRPRACLPDPEAPDLGVGGPAQGGAGTARDRIECLVTRAGRDGVALLFVDEAGWVLREEVPLAELEARLREIQALLRVPPRPMALALRVGPGFESVGGWKTRPPEVEVELRVVGTLPFGLGVEFRGERFGAGAPLGWRAAALAALSNWPPGATGRIRVTGVTVDAGDRPASGLQRLYARSLAVRRIEGHIRTQLRLKGGGGRVESKGNAEIGER